MYSLMSTSFAMDPTLLRLEVLVLCLTLTVILYRWVSSRTPLPPGPKGYPIFGNTLPKALCVLPIYWCWIFTHPLIQRLSTF